MHKNILWMNLAVSLALLGCGKAKDIDKIGDAQLCLDHLGSSATAGQVNECLTKVDDILTPAAHGLRCAGAFMKEGFLNPNKLVNAFDQLTTANSTAGFMSLITFTSSANITTDTSNSYKAFNSCLLSEGKGSTLLASFGYVAMSMYGYMNAADPGSCSNTPSATGYPFAACVTGYSSNVGNITSAANLVDSNTANAAAQTVQASIGTVLISTFNISCSGTSANSQLCTQLQTAITAAGGAGNPRKVATSFFTTLL